jgi:hypothetical protein
MRWLRVIRRIILGCLWLLAYFAVLGAVLMLLWNALIPDLFQGPAITFMQAVGLLLLAHLLLRRRLFSGGPGWRYPYWRHQWRDTSRSKRGKPRGDVEENPD